MSVKLRQFRDDHAFSLLHWAAKGGFVSIVEMLLARGARVNVTNMGDDTPLHLAAAHGHRQIVVVSLRNYLYYKLIVEASQQKGWRKCGKWARNDSTTLRLFLGIHWNCRGFSLSFYIQTYNKDLIAAGALIGQCNRKGLSVLDVCQPQCRGTVIGLFSCLHIIQFQKLLRKTVKMPVKGFHSKMRHGKELVQEQGTLHCRDTQELRCPPFISQTKLEQLFSDYEKYS